MLFAGRLIPEKHVTLAVAAIALAVERIDGLARRDPRRRSRSRGARRGDSRAGPGARSSQRRGSSTADTVAAEMRRALCMLLTSRREGYGLVVVEAAAHGTPSVVVAGEDNAATELIVEGVNGTIAASSDPDAVADAIVRVH